MPRKVLGMAVLAATLVAAPSAAQQPSTRVDSATAATVRRLLAMTGAARLSINAMENVIPAQRLANPQVPGAFWDAFLEHAKRDTAQLLELLVPIYAAHLTRAELDELVKFYQSPIGQRLAAVQPLILQESMQAGQTWGGQIGRQVADSLAQASAKMPPE